MKSTLANVRELAKQLGATVEVDGPSLGAHYEKIHIDLPPGRHFLATDSNLIVEHSDDYGRKSRKMLYADLIYQMNCGVGDCPEGGCSECDDPHVDAKAGG